MTEDTLNAELETIEELETKVAPSGGDYIFPMPPVPLKSH